MKPGITYYPKPELVAEYPRIHNSITLLEKITKPHYAQRGQWVVEITTRPENTNADYLLTYNQVWAEEQITALFDTEREN